MKLSDSTQTFVSHFGEMGSRWGINRTVGQIYALLYISEEPLCADEIGDTLGFSRSNVSMGLKELDSWRLIRTKHYQKDRKDYFTVPEDVWEIVRTLIEERKKREIDPTLSMLRDVIMTNAENDKETYAQHKMQDMHDLIEMLTKWYQDMEKMETTRLVNLLKLGSKVYKLYEMKDKLTLISGGKKTLEEN
ncbi:MAG: ArsR family transcriptional regulator [Alphaproteobacteria bacterium CG11_big_fil_rev_8_21_14_0_20_39_49]|nr:MAG: ArsR family transcriptional regulator [Alphaproteobacteria bacterium CG11_big_fil_rev_8_21_14_0_20_39_49]